MKILNRCLKHLFLIVSAGLILLPLWMVISVAGTQNTDVIGSTAPLYPNVSLLIQHLNEVLFKGVLGCRHILICFGAALSWPLALQ